MMMKTRWPKQAGVLLPGILCAILIWYAGVGVARAACNAGDILYTTLTIELSKDVVCVGGTVTATVTTVPTDPPVNVTLTSDSSRITITPTDGLRTPAEFTITGVTNSDLPGDVPLVATIISGEETAMEISCAKTESLTVLKVDIKKGGNVITDTTTDVIVGEKIALEGVLQPSGLTIASKQWTIQNSGEVIKKWEPEWNDTGGKAGTGALEAHIQPLTTLDQSTVSFYWVDGSFSGNSREVKYKVTVNGTECEGKATFKVHRPTAEVTVTSDQVYLDHPSYAKPGHWMHYGLGGFGPPRGVAAQRTISVPSGFTSYSDPMCYDGANWVQLINVNREMKDGIWYEKKSGGYYLDESCPYAGGTEDFNDSPAQQLESPNVFSYSDFKVLAEGYKTWLMWRPAGTDTISVPLKRIDWSWSGRALKTGGTWGLVSSGNSTPALSDTTTHPEWTFTCPFDVEEVPIP